jgi:hypothetical protein
MVEYVEVAPQMAPNQQSQKKNTVVSTTDLLVHFLQLLDSCLFFWTMRPRALFYVVPPSLEKRM